MIKSEYDCVVMGAGPAGSTTASLVADAGYSTLLVEREAMPRPHVGESLMPETYWTFQRLGILDKLEQGSFPKKVGVQFVNSTGKESQPFIFRKHDNRDCSETWHVNRAEFDDMLFQHAGEKGADCFDRTRVVDVVLDGDRAEGIVIQQAGGEKRLVSSRVVVDATGQQSLLANRLGLKEVNPDLKKAAIWGHFRGAERDTSQGGVTTIILHTETRDAWFWYIPLADDVVSVGVVGDHEYLLKGRGTPEAIFAEELSRCPGVSQRVAAATREGELNVAKEFSYSTTKSAGDGWVLVGDAWGFIDPVYSSGVYFAMKSGELAADSIVTALEKNDCRGEQLGDWLPQFSAATQWVRKLVAAYYSNEFRVGKFVMEHPQHQGNLTDLLIGRIFGPDVGRIFDDLDPWLDERKTGADSSQVA